MIEPAPFPADTAASTITVKAADLERTEKRLREIGGVLLGYSLNAGTYTLRIVLPPGELIEAWGAEPKPDLPTITSA